MRTLLILRAGKQPPNFEFSGVKKATAGIQLLCCGPSLEYDFGWFDSPYSTGTRWEGAGETAAVVIKGVSQWPHWHWVPMPFCLDCTAVSMTRGAGGLFQAFNRELCTYTVLKTFVISYSDEATSVLSLPSSHCLPLYLFLLYHIVTIKMLCTKHKLPVLSIAVLSAGTAFQISCWAFASMNSCFFAHARL